jgi:hypothetical protein
VEQRPRIRDFAGRLFRNPTIRKLAQAELDAAAAADEELAATASRGSSDSSSSSPGRQQQQQQQQPGGGWWWPQPPQQQQGWRPGADEYVPPPDMDNIQDAKQYKRDFAKWIEFKREQREQQRYLRQVSSSLGVWPAPGGGTGVAC